MLEHAGSGRHRRRDPRTVLGAVGAAIAGLRARHRERVRVVSVAVAGTVQEQRLVQASTLGWGAVDLARCCAAPACRC